MFVCFLVRLKVIIMNFQDFKKSQNLETIHKMLDLIMLESSRQSAVPSATIILFFRALSARTSRIHVMYQACYVTYRLKNFLHKFGDKGQIKP